MKTITLIALLAATAALAECRPMNNSGYGDSPLYTRTTRSCDSAQWCAKGPRVGEMEILYARYGEVEGCGFWRATKSEAPSIVRDFDQFETVPGMVVYRSTGQYPVYTQRVVKGGCSHGALNCAD